MNYSLNSTFPSGLDQLFNYYRCVIFHSLKHSSKQGQATTKRGMISTKVEGWQWPWPQLLCFELGFKSTNSIFGLLDPQSFQLSVTLPSVCVCVYVHLRVCEVCPGLPVLGTISQSRWVWSVPVLKYAQTPCQAPQLRRSKCPAVEWDPAEKAIRTSLHLIYLFD